MTSFLMFIQLGFSLKSQLTAIAVNEGSVMF